MVFLALALAAMVAGVGCGDPGTGSAGDTGGKDALSDRDSTATDDLDGRDAAGDAAEGAVAGATWTDPATGLTWQKDPGDVEGAWEAAVAHCSGLLDGAGWRLPDIDELRSLIRGCPDTITGGPCRESVQCSSAGTDCYDGEACMGCLDGGGPGKGGCFWPPELDGPCEWYWSSTTEADFPGYACFAHFRAAHLSHDDKRNDWGHHAICVR